MQNQLNIHELNAQLGFHTLRYVGVAVTDMIGRTYWQQSLIHKNYFSLTPLLNILYYINLDRLIIVNVDMVSNEIDKQNLKADII